MAAYRPFDLTKSPSGSVIGSELADSLGERTVMMSLPFPESLCHRCAAPPKYVHTKSSVFIRCPLLENKYPPQPVLACLEFKPPTGALEGERPVIRNETGVQAVDDRYDDQRKEDIMATDTTFSTTETHDYVSVGKTVRREEALFWHTLLEADGIPHRMDGLDEHIRWNGVTEPVSVELMVPFEARERAEALIAASNAPGTDFSKLFCFMCGATFRNAQSHCPACGTRLAE